MPDIRMNISPTADKGIRNAVRPARAQLNVLELPRRKPRVQIRILAIRQIFNIVLSLLNRLFLSTKFHCRTHSYKRSMKLIRWLTPRTAIPVSFSPDTSRAIPPASTAIFNQPIPLPLSICPQPGNRSDFQG